MGKITNSEDPDEFVRENREELVYIVRHGQDLWIRALCYAMLIEYGRDPSLTQLRQEIEQAREQLG